jgi:hypothetical protein
LLADLFKNLVDGWTQLVEGRTLDSLQAFFLGMMVAWTPSLLAVAWFVRSSRPADEELLSDERLLSEQ